MKIFYYLHVGLFLTLTYNFNNESYCQSSDIIKKKIVIESKSTNKIINRHSRHIFNEGALVEIKKYSDDKKTHGRITSITDSIIVLKQDSISLSDIRTFSYYKWGNPTLFAGLTLLVSSLLVNDNCSQPYDHTIDGQDLYHYDLIIISAIGAFVGAITSFVGILDLALTKKYNIEKKWKLYTITQK